MKKIFTLTASNKKPAQQVDSVKFEIRKYIARERRKDLPEGVDYWDFDCRLGLDAASANVIHVAEINKKIDAVVSENGSVCYVEVIAKPGIRRRKDSSAAESLAR